MPGKRPRPGQIPRTTSMSGFAPAKASTTSPAGRDRHYPTHCAHLAPTPDDHAPDRTPRTSLDSNAFPPPPPIPHNAGIDPTPSPTLLDVQSPNMAMVLKGPPTPTPTVPAPTLLISSAKLIFQARDHAAARSCKSASDQFLVTSDHFLDFCFLCRKRIGHGRDVFIYRGDSAFCSVECRHRQIVADEKTEKCRSVVVVGVNANHGPVSSSDSNEAALAA